LKQKVVFFVCGLVAALHSFSTVAQTSLEITDAATNDLVDHVRSNPLTSGGYWLELRNVFGEWEKVILVFGYFDPGNEDECLELRDFLSSRNPGRLYRCSPIS